MLPITHLTVSLNKLNADYLRVGQPPEDQLRICKHALLEVCGWSEEAQDNILLACAARITDVTLKSLAEEKIKKNSGFSNDGNFAPLLGLIIGFQGLSVVRTHLRTVGTWFGVMENALNNLKSPRNAHAHTHFDHTSAAKMQHLQQSPAILLNVAQQLHDGLLELEIDLQRRGYC